VRPKVRCVDAPETIEAIMLGMIDQPVALAVCEAQPAYRGADRYACETWLLNYCTDLERLAQVGADVASELFEV